MFRVFLPLWLSACSMIFGVDVPEQTVTAACGMCIFGQPSPAGCYWAIEYEGAYYAVNGPVPKDHDAHGPEGMCTMPRQAIVSGKLRSGQLFADRFDLLPVDPKLVPAKVPAHNHDHGARR